MGSAQPGERVVLTGYADVRDALRQRDLAQALYDAGGAVMAGSLITLHGEAHRRRRRVENRLFRRGTFRRWERHLVPGTIESAYAGPLAAGRADLVRLGRRTITHLTALVAGIDPPRDSADVDALDRLAHAFSAGATAVHSTRDPDELAAEVAAAMREFDARFFAPALARREELLAGHAAGGVAEEDLPRDVLTAVLRNREELGVDRDTVRREVAFYLQAGSHSTANLFTHTADRVLAHRGDPAFTARLRDRRFLQRCVFEALRLHPASPVAWRRATADVRLRSGAEIPAGALVELDVVAANTDPAVWGAGAGEFDPDRALPEGVPPWGHSFGGGMHACIGMELDGGVHATGEEPDDHEPVFGTVTLMLDALLRAGTRPDPADPPLPDPHSSRRTFARYPVLLGEGPRPREEDR